MQKAFTLIEVLTVIAVISIISAIGFYSFRSYQPTLDLSGAARELVSDIRYAQQRSTVEQSEYGVKFFISTDEYSIIKIDGGVIIKSVSLPGGIYFGSVTAFSDDTVKFNPYGAASEPGTIELKNGSLIKTIDIRAAGFVKVLN